MTPVFMALRTPLSKHRWIPHQPELNDASSAEGITGGQKSIRARVAEAGREAVALLTELQPMGTEPDVKGIEELKSWIRSEFMELVGELTLAGIIRCPNLAC